MPSRDENWHSVVCDLLDQDWVAFQKLSRKVTGHLASWRAYDFRDEWDDVVQEVVLSVARAVSEKRLKSSREVAGYVHNATRNRFVSFIRASVAKPPSLELDDDEAGERLAWPPNQEPDVATDLVEQVDRLPEKQRLAIRAVYAEGLTIAEAAENSGIPLGSFRRYLSQGLATLRKRMVET